MSLAIIESRWWSEGNDSVRGFFDTLSALNKLAENDYYYEMFNNGQSMREIFSRMAQRVSSIYIEGHGDEHNIFGAEALCENSISRARFRNIVRNGVTQRGGKLDGIYVGSCWFMNEENASFLFRNHDGNSMRIRWLSGYSEEIDFIESTAIDILFWKIYLGSNEGSALDKATEVARKMKTVFKRKYLYEEMGFDIFARRHGGGIRSLIWE